MKNLTIPLLAACSLPLLIGCAGAGKEPSSAMHVEPGLFVRNAGIGADGFYRLGRHHQEQNRLEQAVDAYRKAIAADSGHLEARNALAAAYAAQGKTNEAIAEFLAILKAAPRAAHIRNNLGYAYYLQGKYAEAADALESAVALEPGNARTFTNLGLAYRQLGEPDKSQLAFAQAARLSGGESAPVRETPATVPPAMPAASAEPVQIATGVPAIPLVPVAQPAAILPVAATPLQAPSLSAFAEAPAPLSRPVATTDTAGEGGYRLVIADGSGRDGFASRIAGSLALNGMPAPQVTRIRAGTQQRVVIIYREHYQQQAQRLANMFAKPPALVKSDQPADEADVRLVLGARAGSGALLAADATLAAAPARQ
jgi:Flp pilus assembly protein TadD